MSRRPVSINEEIRNKYSIYPTIVTDEKLNIDGDLSKIKQVTIYNLNGKKVAKQAAINQTIVISNLSEGQYFLELTTDFGQVSYTFIKK